MPSTFSIQVSYGLVSIKAEKFSAIIFVMDSAMMCVDMLCDAAYRTLCTNGDVGMGGSLKRTHKQNPVPFFCIRNSGSPIRVSLLNLKLVVSVAQAERVLNIAAAKCRFIFIPFYGRSFGSHMRISLSLPLSLSRPTTKLFCLCPWFFFELRLI